MTLPISNWALVAHRTDPEWNPYILIDTVWYEVQKDRTLVETENETVEDYIQRYEFEVVFEGVKE